MAKKQVKPKHKPVPFDDALRQILGVRPGKKRAKRQKPKGN